MRHFRIIPLTLLVALAASVASAQDNDTEALKLTAMEALMAAPPERALPIARRVLEGDGSDELKERALFVLSQIDEPEATELLVAAARDGSGDFQQEAVRMIGIGGNADALAGLAEIYAAGDADVREAVLEAYLIADDADAVYQIALNTDSPDEFGDAVEMLGAMGATEQLRALRSRNGMSGQLIEAYAIAGDVDSLRELAMDDSDTERQARALEGLAITGGDEVNAYLLEIYRGTPAGDVKEAALNAMLIAGYDEGVLELYRESQDPAEKRELLEMLVVMGSETVWDLIDATLEEPQ
jgi:HEAT repeat protein